MSQHPEFKTQLGVIGGSGIYQMQGVEIVNEHEIDTPFGKPSAKVIEAKIDNRSVYFLPRHGVGHTYLPSEVPYLANVYALKKLGVTHVLAVSAVGIMQENIKPGDLVVPNQIFDRTKGIRRSTFFGEGCVGHVEFADPFDSDFNSQIAHAASSVDTQVHRDGTYVCMEGPQFSTRAESHFYRETLRPSIIGMTAIPEAKLVREAEMIYGMLALATDYDCWNENEEDVDVAAVIAVLKANSERANKVVIQLAKELPEKTKSWVFSAASFGIMTQRDLIPSATREKLDFLYGKYL